MIDLAGTKLERLSNCSVLGQHNRLEVSQFNVQASDVYSSEKANVWCVYRIRLGNVENWYIAAQWKERLTVGQRVRGSPPI